MPLYNYRCDRCGEFRAFRPMAESSQSLSCPACGAPSERALSAPFLAGASPSGWLTNPRHGQPGGSWRAACGFGCSHANCA